MNLDQAIKIVKEACASFVGNLQDHSRIQEALLLIEKSLKDKPKPKKKP